MSASAEERSLLLSAEPPGRGAVRLAIVLVICFATSAAIASPFAAVDFGGGAPALVAYATAVLVIDVVTAVLLLAIHAAQPSRAILVLSLGYLFTGLATAPWVLTFPGVFSEAGLLGAGLQTAAVIAAGRRVVFPLAILAYVLLSGSSAGEARQGLGGLACGVVAAVAGVLALTWIAVAGGDALPRLMADSRNAAAAWNAVPLVAALACGAAIALLLRRRRWCGLDLWLLVVLATQLIEIGMLAVIGSGIRFSLGWWAGRAVGFASSSVILVVLTFETMRVYERMLRVARAERRVREDQLAGMQALVGAIAHEVNQPLASIVTNAGAAQRWLDRPEPDQDEARAALARVAAEAHRAADAIDGIRTLLRGKTRAREAVDVTRLVREALSAAENELASAGVSVRLRLADALPRVAGDRGQLRQALANLVANAVAAMRAASGPRVLSVEAAARGDSVCVRVEDTGPGVPTGAAERIFEPFFTTKEGGIGLGLMIARSAIQAHGGTIAVRPGSAQASGTHGAAFEIVLPAIGADQALPDVTETREQGVPASGGSRERDRRSGASIHTIV